VLRFRFALNALLLAILTAGCTDVLGPGYLSIRVRNAGPVAFDVATLGFRDQTVQYGRLAAGEATSYRSVRFAYSYAYVEVEAAGRRFTRVPIDYVGETPLARGSYTFEIALDLESGELTQRAIRD